jgi:hypothetical protein
VLKAHDYVYDIFEPEMVKVPEPRSGG